MIKSAYSQWEFASRKGFFQEVDARIKISFLIFFLIIVSLKKDIGSELIIGFFSLFLMTLSRLNILHLYRKILFLGFLFGFLVALPSIFNLFREGDLILTLFRLSGPYQFWIYSIPETIGITRQGLYGFLMLTLRVINSLSITFLVLYTTPFPQILKALKMMKIPDPFLIILTLSYKYLFLFVKTVEDMHLAKKSRLLGDLDHRDTWRWIAGRIAFLFRKTGSRGEEVYRAMCSRGFFDSIEIHEPPRLVPRDWAVAFFLFLIGILLLWL